MQQEELETRRVRCLNRRIDGDLNVVEEIQVMFEDFLTEVRLTQEVTIGSNEFFLMFKGVLFGEGYDSLDYYAWMVNQTKCCITPWYREVLNQ